MKIERNDWGMMCIGAIAAFVFIGVVAGVLLYVDSAEDNYEIREGHWYETSIGYGGYTIDGITVDGVDFPQSKFIREIGGIGNIIHISPKLCTFDNPAFQDMIIHTVKYKAYV